MSELRPEKPAWVESAARAENQAMSLPSLPLEGSKLVASQPVREPGLTKNGIDLVTASIFASAEIPLVHVSTGMTAQT